MELFYFYDLFFEVCRTLKTMPVRFGMSLTNAHFLGMIIGAGIWIVMFILQGFGLNKMGKKRGIAGRWMAFVPFLNYIYMGRLVGECNMFGHKVKKTGVFVMIAQIAVSLFCVALLVVKSYLFLVGGEPSLVDGVMVWDSVNISPNAEYFYRIGAGYALGISIYSILELVYKLLFLILIMNLFKKYSPKNYTWLALLGILVTSSRFIMIFYLRNRDEVNWDEYVRQRREAFARQYQQMYGNTPYGTPYGGASQNGNPYGSGTPYDSSNAGRSASQSREEEPFAEFNQPKDGEEEKPETKDEETGGEV